MTLLRWLIYSLLLSSPALCENYQVHPLNPGKTISELLFYDLNMSPIYGDQNALEKVLNFNALSSEEARQLPEKFPVKVPTSLIQVPLTPIEEKIPEVTPIVEIPPDTPAPSHSETRPIGYTYALSLIVDYYNFSGKNQYNNFDINIIMPRLRLDTRSTSEFFHGMVLELSNSFLKGKETTLINNHTLAGQVGFKQGRANIGFLAGLKRDFFFKANKTEELFDEIFLPMLGLRWEHGWHKFNSALQMNYFLPSRVFNNQKTSANLNFVLEVSYPMSEAWSVLSNVYAGQKDYTDNESTYLAFGLGVTKPF